MLDRRPGAVPSTAPWAPPDGLGIVAAAVPPGTEVHGRQGLSAVGRRRRHSRRQGLWRSQGLHRGLAVAPHRHAASGEVRKVYGAWKEGRPSFGELKPTGLSFQDPFCQRRRNRVAEARV